jgi:hypothetical protein
MSRTACGSGVSFKGGFRSSPYRFPTFRVFEMALLDPFDQFLLSYASRPEQPLFICIRNKFGCHMAG